MSTVCARRADLCGAVWSRRARTVASGATERGLSVIDGPPNPVSCIEVYARETGDDLRARYPVSGERSYLLALDLICERWSEGWTRTVREDPDDYGDAGRYPVAVLIAQRVRHFGHAYPLADAIESGADV